MAEHFIRHDAAAVLKVILGYCQVLHVVASFSNVRWPPIFTSFLNSLKIELSINLFLDLGHWIAELSSTFYATYAVISKSYGVLLRHRLRFLSMSTKSMLCSAPMDQEILHIRVKQPWPVILLLKRFKQNCQ